MLAPPAAQPTPAVVSYPLVNTNLDIEPLIPGALLDMATLPTRHLNIQGHHQPRHGG